MTDLTFPATTTPDTYTGKWTRRGIPTGAKAETFTAAEIAATVGPTGVIWASFGHVNGRECFARNRYAADSTGALHIYAATGARVITHPAGRALRVLTRPAGA